MVQKNDPEILKIPAYMRSKAIVKRDRQRLLWTAWDRKEAGVKPNSPRALGNIERKKPNQISGPVVPGRSLGKLSRPQTFIKRTNQEENFKKDDTQIMTVASQKHIFAGVTTHYLGNIDVAIIKTTTSLKIGDILLIEGDNFIFTQTVSEMQIDRQPVNKAKKGSHIGLKVNFDAIVNGKVYLVK